MSNNNIPPKEKPSGSREPPVAHLACEPCKKRKIKCDREYPTCTTCRLFNRECVAVIRPRLPRGRKGGRKEASSELRARVNRLENLVQTLSKNSPADAEEVQSSLAYRSPKLGSESSLANATATTTRLPSSRGSPAAGTSSLRVKKDSISSEGGADAPRYLGASLWETLSQEVSGIRAILAEPDDDDDSDHDTAHASASTPEDLTPQSDLIAFSSSAPCDIPEPGSDLSRELSSLYVTNVDPVVRLAYAPSMRAHLETGAPYLDYDAQSPQLEALKAAIFYACVLSTTPLHCLQRLGGEQAVLRDLWRSATEAALNKANFLNTEDLATLQALVIYVCCLRTQDSSRTPWALAALMVRIAEAMGLHREETYKSLPFFEAEIARRTWYRIMDQDLQFAVDRGTDLLVKDDGFNTRRPLNINDSDMPPGTVDAPEPRIGFTDNAFMSLISKAALTVRRINFVSPGAAERAHGDERDDWHARTQVVQDYLDFCQTIAVPGVPGKNFFQLEVIRLARTISSALELWVVRPLQRHPGLPPPPYASAVILSLSMRALEHFGSMAQMSKVNPYRWCAAGYVPWHPFAVLMAELCQDQVDVELAERAWRVVDDLYGIIQHQIAEGAAGPLWAPIKKLMRKAEKKRPSSIMQSSLLMSRMDNGLPGTSQSMVPQAPDPDTTMFDPAQFGYANVQTITPNLLPSDTLWPSNTTGASTQQMQQDPSWNEWSMFMDNVYIGHAPSDDNMWACPADQQMFESLPASKPQQEEPAIYNWAA